MGRPNSRPTYCFTTSPITPTGYNMNIAQRKIMWKLYLGSIAFRMDIDDLFKEMNAGKELDKHFNCVVADMAVAYFNGRNRQLEIDKLILTKQVEMAREDLSRLEEMGISETPESPHPSVQNLKAKIARLQNEHMIANCTIELNNSKIKELTSFPPDVPLDK